MLATLNQPLNHSNGNGAKKKKIIFVDDEPSLLECFEILFEPMANEWDLSFQTSGAEALALMKQKSFDVIVSDMRMPGMNGAQLLVEVVQLHPHIIRFILSGYAEQEAVAKCVGAAHQFLMKPCQLETLKSALVRVCALDVFLRNDKLKALVSKMGVLPSVPSVYFQVLTELQSPYTSVEKIGEIIATDPGMTAKLLQMVNSAFFGISRRISSPTEAVQLLGIGTVRSLALSIHAFSSFEESQATAFFVQRVWNHSLQTGLGARKVAQLVNEDAQMADEAFIAGLLHDLGKMMLCSNNPDEYQRAFDLACAQHITIGEAERQMFGATHADVGAYLLGLWGLPVSIVEGVALHHTPAKAALRTFSPLTAVHVANVLQHECVPESKGEVPSSLDADYLAGLRVQEYLPQWRAAVARISKESTG